MKTFHRLISAALICLMVIEPVNASVIGSLDSMFLSNSTSPSQLSTADRNGFMFGGASIHVPVQNMNLISFDPPRFNAGCGGIDLYLGSFSFVNSAQLVALFKQIVANAAAALFYSAIQSLSPNIADIMSKFQKVVGDLNNMFRNTCQMGLAGAAAASQKFSQLSTDSGSAINAASGYISDFFNGQNASPSQAASNLTASNPAAGGPTPASGTTPGNADVGNFVWKMFSSTTPENQLNPAIGSGGGAFTSTGSDAVQQREFLMSFIGTNVNNPGSTPTDNSQTPNTNSNNTSTFGPYQPTLKFHDLIAGSGPSAPGNSSQKYILGCTDDSGGTALGDAATGCMTIDKYRQWDFEGTDSLVHKMLFGTSAGGFSINSVGMSEPTGQISPDNTVYSNGIIYLVSHCPGTGATTVANITTSAGYSCGMTPAQIAFLNAMNAPIETDLIHMQSAAVKDYGNGYAGVFNIVEKELSLQYAIKLASAILSAANYGISGSAAMSGHEPDLVSTSIASLKQELDSLRVEALQANQSVALLNHQMEIIMKANPNVLQQF